MSAAPSASPRSRFRWLLYVAIVAAAGIGVWYFRKPQKPAHNNRGPNPAWAGNAQQPAIPVRVAAAAKRDLPVRLKAIGTVTPLNTVTVRSRVDGQIMRLAFEEGQRVEQGQLLVEIDPEPFRIQLAQTEGQQRQNVALLETARADLERVRPLFDRKLVTTQEMDAQVALVREREGALAADKARVDEAKMRLDYTRVTAPISGRLGLRRVDAGNLVRANDTDGLVTITQTQPINVLFTIPEVDLAKVLEPLRGGGALTVEAWDRSERTMLARGRLTTVDNQIDVATGTLRLKAEFPNEDDRLFPNQFVNITLEVNTLRDAVLVPAAAIQYGSRGTYVYVIDDKDKAQIRQVELGPSDGTSQAITKGINPGDRVVLEGLDRLREGRTVVVVRENETAPAPKQP